MGSTPIGISGSRSAAVLGLSKYQTPVAIWQQICELRNPGFNAKNGYILEPFEGNASTRFGLAFEDAVIELTEQETGEKITDQEGEYFLDGDSTGDVPITCHIDGRFSADKIYEGKTVYIRGFESWGEPGTDRIPQEYQCQVQHNMMLTGAKECHVSALIFPKSPTEWEDEGWSASVNGSTSSLTRDIEGGGIEIANPSEWAFRLSQMGYFKTYTVKANPVIQELLKEKYLEFWTKYVLTETPPPIDGYDDIKNLFPEPKGTLVVSDLVASKCREYKSINGEIGKGGHLSKRKDQIKVDILKLCLTETTVADDESIEKIVLRDPAGNKCGSFDGKTFRA